MKKILVSLVWLVPALAQAQDTLFLTNNEIISCEIFSSENVNIEYTPWKKDNPVYSINKTMVDSIHYNTGEVEYISSYKQIPDISKSTATNQTVKKTYMEGYTSGLTAPIGPVGTPSFVGGFCCGVAGVVAPVVTISNAEDKVPIEKRLSGADYDQGYTAGVKKQVRKKAWNNYAAGFGSLILAYVALVVAGSL